jgi:hypothetical protein
MKLVQSNTRMIARIKVTSKVTLQYQRKHNPGLLRWMKDNRIQVETHLLPTLDAKLVGFFIRVHASAKHQSHSDSFLYTNAKDYATPRFRLWYVPKTYTSIPLQEATNIIPQYTRCYVPVTMSQKCNSTWPPIGPRMVTKSASSLRRSGQATPPTQKQSFFDKTRSGRRITGSSRYEESQIYPL